MQSSCNGKNLDDATAFPTWSASYDLVVIGALTNADGDEANIAWTRRFHSAMERWSTHLAYVNALDQDDVDRIPQAYGPNYKRLCEVEAKYDPENRFRRNQNTVRLRTQIEITIVLRRLLRIWFSNRF